MERKNNNFLDVIKDMKAIVHNLDNIINDFIKYPNTVNDKSVNIIKTYVDTINHIFKSIKQNNK